MKIAIIQTPLIYATGGERQSLELAIELEKLGHEVEIFTNAVNEQECYPELLKKVSINVIPHPLQRFRSHPSSSEKPVAKTQRIGYYTRAMGILSYYVNVLPRMFRLGRSISKGFDILNNHNFPTEWAAFFAKQRLRAPVVWMCNDPPFWFWHPETRGGRPRALINWPLFEALDKIAVGNIDEIVALSHFAASMIKNIYGRSSKIVRSGVDIDLFHNASGKEIRQKYDITDDFVLLQVGTLHPKDPYKRQIDSIKTLSHLSKRHDNVKLMLEGFGPPETLKKVSRKLRVEDKVIFLFAGGSDERLGKIYAACDAFIFPSEVTWGLAVTEAMAAAKPVIVSRNCGASEIIQNNVNGIIVDHAKPKEIAKQVERLINYPKLCRRLGENAYEHVKKNLSWKKYAENMESVFVQTISSFKRS